MWRENENLIVREGGPFVGNTAWDFVALTLDSAIAIAGQYFAGAYTISEQKPEAEVKVGIYLSLEDHQKSNRGH